jgi:hypothetical protein
MVRVVIPLVCGPEGEVKFVELPFIVSVIKNG